MTVMDGRSIYFSTYNSTSMVVDDDTMIYNELQSYTSAKKSVVE